MHLTVEASPDGGDGNGNGNGGGGSDPSSGGKGITIIIIAIAVLALIGIAAALFLIMKRKGKEDGVQSDEQESQQDQGPVQGSEDETVPEESNIPPTADGGWYTEVPPIRAPTVGDTPGAGDSSWGSSDQGDQ
jgi:flagellar basal body-associated protein FliL